MVDRGTENEREQQAWVRILAADGIGLATARTLVRGFGSACRVITARREELVRVLGLGASAADAVHEAIRCSNPAVESRWLRRRKGRLVPFGDSCYPSLLVACPDAPGLLRCQGSLPGHGVPCIAVVGSRRATSYGLRMAAMITAGLVEHGCWVVSGGARGIDAEVHRTALRLGGRTACVLGSGLAHPYPSEHRGLFDRIVEHEGCVLSQFTCRQKPRPGLFPRRNRIVSGMSHAVVVVEAARRSGALITARVAVEEHGRDAMVVPGAADSASSGGCHAAVQDGWAHLITSAADVIRLLEEDYSAARALNTVA